MAQARLGPGRIHHCMRTIGQCEVAIEMMCDRALRLADGPDEVHLRTVARNELGRARAAPGRSIPYFTLPARLG